jgi:hypothetical protein
MEVEMEFVFEFEINIGKKSENIMYIRKSLSSRAHPDLATAALSMQGYIYIIQARACQK